MRWFRVATAALAITLAPAAMAAPQGGGDTHGEEAHGDDGGHHAYHYTADDDHDGTPNWMDPTNGEEENDHYVLSDIGFHVINLILFIGLIVWFGRRPIKDALAQRALGIRKEITDSAAERDAARQRAEELQGRLDKIEQEIERMRAEARTEAETEERKLQERAATEAQRIAKAAERSIRDEVTRARNQLKRDAVVLAVELAEATLRQKISGDDQQRLAREFLDSVNSGEATHVQ